MGNFVFLEKKYSQLANLGLLAEQYLDTDPSTCIAKLRTLTEYIAKEIYYQYFEIKPNIAYIDILKALNSYIPSKYMDIFHIIRKKGNKAIHENIASYEDAFVLLKYTFGVAVWFFIIDGGNEAEVQSFEKPSSRLLLLEKELEDAKKREENLAKELENKIQEIEKQELTKETLTEKLKRLEEKSKSTKTEEKVIRYSDFTEAETRNYLIDEQLKDAGWKIRKITNYNVNSKEFNTSEVKREIPVTGLIITPSGNGFVDYVLYNDSNQPIAIIEAKKTYRDVKEGKEQARQYANALEKMTGFRPLIFYTNGFETYFWDDAFYPERRVYGLFSKEDIETRLFQRENRQNLAKTEIDNDIISRDYQFMALRKTYEAFSVGQRKSLIVMATGTGKTRTAMAIVDGLVRANWVKRVLFLVDRDELRKQADNAFKKHLDSLSRVLLNSETKGDLNKRVYIATYPAMMQAYSMYSPGFFDLIIADESHRSVYNVYGEIFKYFDAFQIGLTATPVNYISRNTYSLFDTDDGNPTFSYELEDAIAEQYLVPYKVQKVQTGFLGRGIKYNELTPKQKKELEEQVEDPDLINFEKTQLENAISNKDTNRKIIRTLMEKGLRDANGELGKSIIFARNHEHGELLETLFNEMYPQYKGKYARLIDSHDQNASTLLDNFKGESQENEINIAISISMLDTGVDVPEIMNLVFAKPIYSKVKFWQMIGRGTRLCENLIAPGKNKEYFVIFDNYENFEFFGENPEGYEPKEQLSLYEKLFKARISLALTAKELNITDIFNKTVQLLKSDIETLPKKSVDVMEKAMLLDDVLKTGLYWQNFDETFAEQLDNKIRPLMKRQKTSYEIDKAIQFDINVTQLQIAELEKIILIEQNISTKEQDKKIDLLKNKMRKSVFQLRTNINKVKEKENIINKVKDQNFGNPFNFDDLETARTELNTIMQYRQKQDIEDGIIEIDVSDDIEIDEELKMSLFTTFGESYKHDIETILRKLASDNIILQKIKKGKPITEQELQSLVSIVLEQNPHFSLKQLEKLYPDKASDLNTLIRTIVGVDEEEIKNRIQEFKLKHTTLNSMQINCLKLVENQLKANNYFKETSLYDKPFTNLGDIGEIFTEQELSELYSTLDGYMIKERITG